MPNLISETYPSPQVSAHKLNIPYYVAASYNKETLPEPQKVKIGDGQVIGGYLNYPLEKGKKYNYEVSLTPPTETYAGYPRRSTRCGTSPETRSSDVLEV